MSAEGGDPRVGHVETGIHGRYLLRRAAADARGTLCGFHGYGEDSAANFAQLARVPGSADWDLVAINGLHRFYTRSGEVVGSWMTSSDRELMIADNRVYVTRVLDQVAGPRPLVAVGFSQGVAMAYRSAAIAELKIDGVVALAGDLPPELAEGDLSGFPPVLIARGDREEWYTAERAEADAEILRRAGVDVELFEFAGGHEWTDETRARIARFAAMLSGRHE